LNAGNVREAQTLAYISREPSDVSLSRSILVDDGAGGEVPTGPVILRPQKVRLVGLRAPRRITTADGRTVEITNLAIGMPDLDVQIGDTFDLEYTTWEVVGVSDRPRWRKTAEVVDRARR
jgi:hypothetical protein